MPEDTGSFLGIFSWEWHVFAFEIDFQSVPGSILCYQYEYVQWPLAFIWNISGYCIRLLIYIAVPTDIILLFYEKDYLRQWIFVFQKAITAMYSAPIIYTKIQCKGMFLYYCKRFWW